MAKNKRKKPAPEPAELPPPLSQDEALADLEKQVHHLTTEQQDRSFWDGLAAFLEIERLAWNRLSALVTRPLDEGARIDLEEELRDGEE